MENMAVKETRRIAVHLICLGDRLNERYRGQQRENNFDVVFQNKKSIFVSGILLGISVGMLSFRLILQSKC